MTLVRSLFVILLLFVSSGARAAVSCDALLSFASSAVSEETKGLSESARAYVNLIKLYIEKSGGELDTATASAILNAESFVNPFADRKDSVSTQMASAIKTLQSRIGDKDWTQIKSAVQKLIQNSKSEVVDRLDKEEETNGLIDIKLLPGSENRSINSNFSTYTINGRTFLASNLNINGGGLGLAVYEITSGQLSYITDVKIPNYGKPVWHFANGRLYLFAKSTNRCLYAYEFDQSQLKPIIDQHIYLSDAYPFIGSVKGRMLVLAGHLGADKLYEVIDGKMQFISELPYLWKAGFKSAHFQEIDGKIILLANSSGDRSNASTELYVLEDDKLTRIKTLDFGVRSDKLPSWYMSNGRLYTAVESADSKLHVFELINENFMKLASVDLPEKSSTSPLWLEHHGRLFLALARDNLVNIFEFSVDQLNFIDEVNVPAVIQGISADIPFSSKEFRMSVFDAVSNRYIIQILKQMKKKGRRE